MRRIDHVSLWPSTLDVTATVGHTKFALCQSTKCKFHSIGHTGQTYHVTLTFNLGGHGACHWCMSVSSIRTPTLKFLCLTIPKIWHILCICISWPVTLNFKLETGAQHSTCHGYHHANFGDNTTIHFRFMGNRANMAQDWSRDLAILTFDLGGHDACDWCRSLSSIRLPSLKFVGLVIRKIWYTMCQH